MKNKIKININLFDAHEHCAEISLDELKKGGVEETLKATFDGAFFETLKRVAPSASKTAAEGAQKTYSGLSDKSSRPEHEMTFLAALSHQFKTPLNAIIGFSELIKSKSKAGEELWEYAEGVNTSANAMLITVNEVIDYTMLEAGKVELSEDEVCLQMVLKNLLKIMEPQAASKGLKLDLHIPHDIPTIVIDSQRLSRIITNILSNAIKFTWKGAVELSARADLKERQKCALEIAVTDTGCGVKQEHLPKIFEAFERPAAIKGCNGLGLGLNICKRLAAIMGGGVTVRSEEGKGSVFTVRFDNLKCTQNAASSADSSKPLKIDGHVVVIDDIALNLKVICALLEKLGVDSKCYTCANEAFASIKNNPPKAVLTDIWMPDFSGEQLVHRLRKDSSTRHIPVIAVTADSTFTSDVFDGILFKPISKDSLRAVLAELFS